MSEGFSDSGASTAEEGVEGASCGRSQVEGTFVPEDLDAAWESGDDVLEPKVSIVNWLALIKACPNNCFYFMKMNFSTDTTLEMASLQAGCIGMYRPVDGYMGLYGAIEASKGLNRAVALHGIYSIYNTL